MHTVCDTVKIYWQANLNSIESMFKCYHLPTHTVDAADFARPFVLSEGRETQKHSERDALRKYIGLRNHLFRNKTKNTPFGEKF